MAAPRKIAAPKEVNVDRQATVAGREAEEEAKAASGGTEVQDTGVQRNIEVTDDAVTREVVDAVEAIVSAAPPAPSAPTPDVPSATAGMLDRIMGGISGLPMTDAERVATTFAPDRVVAAGEAPPALTLIRAVRQLNVDGALIEPGSIGFIRPELVGGLVACGAAEIEPAA